MAAARQAELTYVEALRRAVHAIIDADLSLQETRDAVMSLIPEEYRVGPYVPAKVPDRAGIAPAVSVPSDPQGL